MLTLCLSTQNLNILRKSSEEKKNFFHRGQKKNAPELLNEHQKKVFISLLKELLGSRTNDFKILVTLWNKMECR